MAKLAGVVESLDAVEEGYRGAYVEQDGKFVLDADIEGHPAVGALKRALDSERKIAKEALRKAQAAGDPAEIERLKAELDELKGKSGGEPKPPDAEKLRKKWEEENAPKFKALEDERDKALGELRTLRLDDKVRDSALKAGVLPDDMDDVLLITKRYFTLDDQNRVVMLDEDGDPTGTTPEKWFTDVFKVKKPKYFKGTGNAGSGAKGSDGRPDSAAELDKLPPAARLTRARAMGLQ
jgi:hypothetical protein